MFFLYACMLIPTITSRLSEAIDRGYGPAIHIAQAHLRPVAIKIVFIMCGAAPVVLKLESAAERETSCSVQATNLQSVILHVRTDAAAGYIAASGPLRGVGAGVCTGIESALNGGGTSARRYLPSLPPPCTYSHRCAGRACSGTRYALTPNIERSVFLVYTRQGSIRMTGPACSPVLLTLGSSGGRANPSTLEQNLAGVDITRPHAASLPLLSTSGGKKMPVFHCNLGGPALPPHHCAASITPACPSRAPLPVLRAVCEASLPPRAARRTRRQWRQVRPLLPVSTHDPPPSSPLFACASRQQGLCVTSSSLPRARATPKCHALYTLDLALRGGANSDNTDALVASTRALRTPGPCALLDALADVARACPAPYTTTLTSPLSGGVSADPTLAQLATVLSALQTFRIPHLALWAPATSLFLSAARLAGTAVASTVGGWRGRAAAVGAAVSYAARADADAQPSGIAPSGLWLCTTRTSLSRARSVATHSELHAIRVRQRTSSSPSGTSMLPARWRAVRVNVVKPETFVDAAFRGLSLSPSTVAGYFKNVMGIDSQNEAPSGWNQVIPKLGSLKKAGGTHLDVPRCGEQTRRPRGATFSRGTIRITIRTRM
ncbi:hypothetical protein B0H19DRAFT_1263928 [Mycena capillaripes]|nr:hypothetical protein B0H19DRAFT_1263928 [Mycena capillaripes]